MKILIWGTGQLTGKVVGKIIGLEDVIGFIDNDTSKKTYMEKNVYTPSSIYDLSYDAILVSNMYTKEIFEQCQSLGIDTAKVIFLYNNCNLSDINKDYVFIEKILGTDYSNIIKNRHTIIRKPPVSGHLCFKDSPFSGKGYLKDDYVRSECFELAVKEIYKRSIPGSVAEVGVFRGEFAQYINYAFPDRLCYLFDTFDGFDAVEALNEIKSKNCTASFVEAYKQTNVGIVLDRMTYLENIIIKQGLFPDSLNGLEDSFAFVSIDVDFEESIYNCISYFYPRLNKGGYIFIHDYNNDLRGVEKAVDRYEEYLGEYIPKVPICDANGSLVITK